MEKYKRIARVSMTTSKRVNLEFTFKILRVLGQVFLLHKLTACITNYDNKYGYLQTRIK